MHIKAEFLNYLLELEHTEKTSIDYVCRVSQVCRVENFKSLEEMQETLNRLILKYSEKNNRYVLPLKKLNGFFLERHLLGDSSFETNMMCMLTRTLDPETGNLKLSNDNGSDFLTSKELADYIEIDERTLKRWRQKRIGPDWEKIGGKIHYPLIYLAKFLQDQKNK